jgi:hypothetical protein
MLHLFTIRADHLIFLVQGVLLAVYEMFTAARACDRLSRDRKKFKKILEKSSTPYLPWL